GGLRDIHSLRWVAGWMVGEVGLDPLVAAGYLGATDRRRLARANETLLRARCALHLSGRASRGKDADVLRLDRQDEVAALLGERDADVLLRDVGLATRTVGHLHDRTWRLVLADASRGRRRLRSRGADLGGGLHTTDGLVGVDTTASLVEDPALGLRAVAAAAQHDTHLTREAAARLTDEVARLRTVRWTQAGREALLSLLRAGDNAADGLQEADHLGLFAAMIPDWHRVRGRAQRNPLHRFDLDTHGARAVVSLHRLRRDESLDTLWQRQDETDSLILGTWLHDIGKAWDGDHSIVGADVAARWLKTMGFGDDVAQRVMTLVRHHLLLPAVATRRDLDDPVEIRKVAEAVRDRATLDSLYLLSLADARATGPAAWSSWKASLMATLHQRVGAMLGGAERFGQPDPVRQARLAGVAADDLAALEAQAPARYFDIADAGQIAAHARLLGAMGSGATSGVDVRGGSVAGTTVVSVVARDRPRLLADCTGVLAANDLGVVQARAITTDSGTALDWLVVTGEVAADALANQLVAAVAQRVEVAALLNRPRRRGFATVAPWRPPTVIVRDELTLEVEASDQPGLLYRLCAAIAQCGHSLAAVRVSTLAHNVFDVFELTQAADDAQLDTLRHALLTAARAPEA
ncbi:MAG: HD domain-containing protein, partial [Nitriliruptorales bacterium]|nr:HD domain-containing protein [Nitriliruptorales bacterium]